MNQAELKIRVELHQRELTRLRDIKVQCQSCEHYYAYNNRPCCDKFKVTIPPEVVPVGCDDWTYDFVPF